MKPQRIQHTGSLASDEYSQGLGQRIKRQCILYTEGESAMSAFTNDAVLYSVILSLLNSKNTSRTKAAKIMTIK